MLAVALDGGAIRGDFAQAFLKTELNALWCVFLSRIKTQLQFPELLTRTHAKVNGFTSQQDWYDYWSSSRPPLRDTFFLNSENKQQCKPTDFH